MELYSFFIYLAIMAGSTYLIRAIPFAVINKKIENQVIKSFLHYIPFAVLSAMTFPAILYATDYVISAAVGFVVAILFAAKGKSLTTVAVAACVAVFVVESMLGFM
ncbi:MAG: AzlD domain-containing protein [Roseburia sp.]|nr:AzlD domain-containing protein [Roseburia sp.]